MAVENLDEGEDLLPSPEMGDEEPGQEREEIHLAEASTSGGSAIIVNDRFHIQTDTPVPELDVPNAQAFACKDMGDPNHSVFALACTSLLPPRGEDLVAFRRIEREHIIRPIEWGVTDWPHSDHRRFVIVVERPGGRRLVDMGSYSIQPFNEERLTRNMLQPLLQVLKDLQESAVPHRSIRLDNLFFKDAVLGEIVLGEGFASPPAMFQPVIYEPIDSAMADPAGRGVGRITDDIYALGVTMALMLLGRNPLVNKTDEQIIEMKLREGTYGAILGETRIPLSLMEVLRGLLTDDPKDRWNINEVELWLNGRRLSPKQPKLPPKAARPFSFEGVDYHTTPGLAYAFYQKWSAATRCIANEPVDVWLRRGFEDDELAEAFNTAIRAAAAFGGRRGIEDRMLARACIILDPSAPIRFRHFSSRIDGFAYALMSRYVRNGDVRDIAEAVSAKLPNFWLDNQPNQTPEHNLLRRNFEMMAYMLSRTGPGYGIERCLYELNPSGPCLSPLVEKHYVLHINQLLSALDKAAIERSGRGEPMDRHISAFIASRLKHPMDTHLQGLAADRNVPVRRLALIRLLSEVQQFTGEETPPHLAQWLVKLSAPIVETYQNRPFRERLTKEIKRIAEKGSLMDLAYALENTSRREKDSEGFREAIQEYAQAEQEIQKIEGGEMTKPEVIERKGQEVAAIASGVIASFALILYLLIRLVSNAPL